MPFVSSKQRSYLFAKKPAVAKEFAAATPKGAKLPEYVGGVHPVTKALAGMMRKKRRGGGMA